MPIVSNTSKNIQLYFSFSVNKLYTCAFRSGAQSSPGRSSNSKQSATTRKLGKTEVRINNSEDEDFNSNSSNGNGNGNDNDKEIVYHYLSQPFRSNCFNQQQQEMW
mmetsp:Transcript_62005/g.151445  ORF Transcript_62005/g.151445 Transcript_62005/m.151445 type:complete len:106 (+) Transcript_62005:2082-2399(+)